MNTKPGHESERPIPSRERVRRPRRGLIGTGEGPEALESRQLMSSDVWQGANTNFNDPTNWSGGTVPVSGDTLVFGSNAAGTAETTSLPASLTPGAISVQSNFALTGTLNVAGNIPISVAPSATLTLAGGTAIQGNGTVTLPGAGTLAINTAYVAGGAVDTASASVTFDAQQGAITLGASGQIESTFEIESGATLTEVNNPDGKNVSIDGFTVTGASDGTAGNIEVTSGNTFAPTTIDNGFYTIDHGAVFSPSQINGGYFTQEGPNTIATDQALNGTFTLVKGGTAAVQASNYGSTFSDGLPAGQSTPNDFVVNVVPNQGVSAVFGSSVTGGGKFITSGLGNVILSNGIKEASGALEATSLTNTGDTVLGSAQTTLATSIDIPNSPTLTLSQWSTLNLATSSLTVDKAVVALNQNTSLSLNISGTNPGTQYGQLISGGGINLDNATLTIAPTVAIPTGTTFTILQTTGSAQITGKFAGLSQGTVFAQNGIDFQINYSAQAVTITSKAQATTTTITGPIGAIQPGQEVTLSTQVGGVVGTPTGTVTFMDGSTKLGTAPLVNGVATLTGLGFGGGNHSLTASYSGDTSFGASTSAPLPQSVHPTNTLLVLYGTVNSADVGQTVLLIGTATSNIDTPTGQVTFYDGTTDLGTATLDPNGHALLPVTNLAVGTHELTASYSGDANDNPTTTAKPQALAITAVPTNVAITMAPAPAFYGQAVVVTAAVVPTAASGFGNPTGSVAFTEGKTLLGVASVNNSGLASLTLSNLPVGKNSITGVYEGDSHFASATNVANTPEVIVAAPTTTSLTVSPNPPQVGRQMLFTANVNSITSGTPTGSVTFKDGGRLLGRVAITGGQAFLVDTLNFTSGQSITATYNGATDFVGSTSGPLILTPPTTVAPPPTTVPTTPTTSAPTPIAISKTTPVTTVPGAKLHGHKVAHPKPVKLVVHHPAVKHPAVKKKK